MTTPDSLRDILKRFEESFDAIKKATKPFATSPLNEATVKGLKKGIAMYIDTCGTIIKDLDGSIKGFPDAAQMRSENLALGSKVQSLAFAAQEAEANLAKYRVEFEEEMRSLKEERDNLVQRLRMTEEENRKVVLLQESLLQERGEKDSLRSALHRLYEENSSERMDWQRKLAGAQAVSWEDRHIVSTQRLSDESLRTHIDDLLSENRSLRTKLATTEQISRPSAPTHSPAGDAALNVLRESLASAKKDYSVLLAENRALLTKNEELSTALASRNIKVLSPAIPPVLATRSPPKLPEALQIRHASSQTLGASFESLESEVEWLRMELTSSKQAAKSLDSEVNSLRAQIASSDEDLLREEIGALRSELKKKSLRISRLVSELDGFKLNGKAGLEQAFEESQRSRASAELEVMALKKQLAYLEHQRMFTDLKTDENAPGRGVGCFLDPLLAIHAEVEELDRSFESSKKVSTEQESRIRDEIEHAEASVAYWEEQPQDLLSLRMLDDARKRLHRATRELDRELRERQNRLESWYSDRKVVVGRESTVFGKMN